MLASVYSRYGPPPFAPSADTGWPVRKALASSASDVGYDGKGAGTVDARTNRAGCWDEAYP